jgi:Uma2 family endonuclease
MTIAKNHPIDQALLIDVSNTTLHSAEEFERLQRDNPDLQMELTEDGKLSVISPGNIARDAAEPAAEVSPQEDKQITHSTSSGEYSFVELTAAETARRVAMVERRSERERQEWDSFTPEQRAEHDRQFDALYESLAESRR